MIPVEKFSNSQHWKHTRIEKSQGGLEIGETRAGERSEQVVRTAID